MDKSNTDFEEVLHRYIHNAKLWNGDDVASAKLLLAHNQSLEAAVKRAVLKARKNEVSRLAQKYRPFPLPIKESPMELTEKAYYFNEIAKDIVLYEDQRLRFLDAELQAIPIPENNDSGETK